MYLAANHPKLFAAELFVDGQWYIDELKGLENESFIYIAAEGDEKASTGQDEVRSMLKESGVSFGEITGLDVTKDADSLNAAVSGLFESGEDRYFINFLKGSVLPAWIPKNVSEHIFAFDYGYQIEAVRDWIYERGIS